MSFTAVHIIDTNRVRVRPVAVADLPAVLAMNSDEKVTRYLGHRPWTSMADAERWFETTSVLQDAGSAREFVIVEKMHGGVIGRCCLFEYEEISSYASLGYILAREHWGKGYMREALTGVITCAFEQMRIRRLEARAEADNLPSSRLLRRLGFTREGVLRERWLTEDEPMDAEIYGLLRREWSPIPGQLPREAAPARRFE